jgi:hypothetical protein
MLTLDDLSREVISRMPAEVQTAIAACIEALAGLGFEDEAAAIAVLWRSISSRERGRRNGGCISL